MPLADNLMPAIILLLAWLATMAGTHGYRIIALRRGILANPNFRSLHVQPVPRGGGLVFSLCILLAVSSLAATIGLDARMMRAVLGGGIVATVFGFFDDVTGASVRAKLFVQAVLAAWTLFSFGGEPIIDLPRTPAAMDLGISWIGLVWMMNLYNFIDGIDGLAATGAILISGTAIAVLLLAGGSAQLMAVFGAAAVCSAGFLIYNWPPASLFMGDAGSVFLGFFFGALLTGTVTSGALPMPIWLILFGYFAGDTTTTTILRMFVAPRWYGEHRSHAYQNLARMWNSHVRVVRGVMLFHALWLTPLAVVAISRPSVAPACAALALLPVVIWTFRHGPLLSSS